MILCCGSQLFIILKMLLIMRRICQQWVFLDDYQSSTSVVTSSWNWPALWNLECNEVSLACSWILNDVSHPSVGISSFELREMRPRKAFWQFPKLWHMNALPFTWHKALWLQIQLNWNNLMFLVTKTWNVQHSFAAFNCLFL